MREGDLTYDDFLQRLNIQDVLIDAGYHLNRRDGLRYPSYVRIDSEGRRIRGDKFIVTQQGKCCFQAQQQKVYNIISFIKEHPQFFTEYRVGMSPDRLVNLVCNRLLNHPIEDRTTRIIQPKRDIRPFDIANYDLHKFNPQDRETQKKFYPYFKSRGRARMDGSGSYKGKAEGSNSSEGLWIASPAKTPLAEAKRIYWFESAYDAMAYYQLNQKWDKELRKGVFVSTGGAPSQQQFKAMIEATPHAYHHLCFDGDRAGQIFAINFALTHAGKTFTSNVTKDDKLLVRISGEENQNYEVKLEPFDFHRIVGTLLRPKEIYREDGTLDYRTIGDGYLQEMSMVCQDEYEMALAEGSASEETLEGMRQNIMAIEDAIRNLPAPGEDSTDLIVYEPADKGYKDWNEQLLAKAKLQESVHEEPARREEPEQERQARFHR